MQVDDPPYLSVGTAVSAKYKGAFCEAKVSKVDRIVKCKINYKHGLGTATVSDEQVKGTLRVGHTVQAKHVEKKEYVEATITKIQDSSQYTVVFDDGDITTLRRSALCLKSGRHFNESETLDQLPLTHPEHFGNPVVGGRRGRRNRHLKDDSSEGEAEEENEPDLEGYSMDIGRVVAVETTDKKRGKDNWFPGLVVIPSAQPTVRINMKDEYLVRSFKDGRYYTVPKKEVTEFNRETGDKVESTVLAEAVGKAVKYLDHNELPAHWERNSLFNMQSIDTDSDENMSDTSDDEPNEEKDRFVAQLYKFMDDSGTPLNKSPMIGNKDVDLHRLFRIVHKCGGYNRVTNQNKWRSVTNRLKFPNNQITYNQVKSVYKKFLQSYENFYRTLGVTMLNHTRSNKKNRGRSLIRDKDRMTPNSPKPSDRDDEGSDGKKDDEKSGTEEKVKPKEEKKRKEDNNSDTNSGGDATDQSESVPSVLGRPRRGDKVKKLKSYGDKREIAKKEDDDKMQQTRSKSSLLQTPKPKECPLVPERKIRDLSSGASGSKSTGDLSKPPSGGVKIAKKPEPADDKKRGRKKTGIDDRDKPGVEIITDSTVAQRVNIGDKLKVYYGPTHESKVTYEAKVIEIDKDSSGPVYLVHYTGWNTRYDEWITPTRIAENLSASTKAKKQKQPSLGGGKSKSLPAGKRGRGMSITGRSTVVEAPRSTTPSSVTSSSSRTKSPATTPATRSSNRQKLDFGRKTRRASAQTDISLHSESDSDLSESETELTRTRSGNKPDEPDLKTYRKRPPRNLKDDKSKDEQSESDNNVKDAKDTEEMSTERPRRVGRRPKKMADESDEEITTNPPKGRDFDLNQIRSELKGFTKTLKVSNTSPETGDKDASSSSSSSICSEETANDGKVPKTETPDDIKPLLKDPIKPAVIEKSSSSEDIYEFKEPEPFEFESRSKLIEEKPSNKKRLPRLFEELEKSPSKKHIIKSPITCKQPDTKESPEVEKKRFCRKTPIKPVIKEESEDEERKDEDPFDKLVESPSYNIIKSAEKLESAKLAKIAPVKSILEEPLSLFTELPEAVDDYSRDMELSDCESQTQPIFSRQDELFSDTFAKSAPDILGIDFTKPDDCINENDDFDRLRNSRNPFLKHSPSSDESDNLSDEDLTITPSTSSYQGKKRENIDSTVQSLVPISILPPPKEDSKIDIKTHAQILKMEDEKKVQQISPALQETDSSLLESICAQPVSIQAKLEETKEISVKTGAKVADSILKKFSSIKNKSDVKVDDKGSDSEQEFKFGVKKESDSDDSPVKLKLEAPTKIKPTACVAGLDVKKELEVKKSPTLSQTLVKAEASLISTRDKIASLQPAAPTKKKKKIVSKAIIEESDTDSSDSEQLVIARDEDSRSNSFADKPELKGSDSNVSSAPVVGLTDDSQSQEEKRNFKFDKILEPPKPVKDTELLETVKDEEPDSQLHSLLLCDETIPRSPTAASSGWDGPETSKIKPNVLEMPFASAPGNGGDSKLGAKSPGQLGLSLADKREHAEDAVLEHSAPSTPESSMSNSPRGDREDLLSPNTVENESGKSNDAEPDYARKRRNSCLAKTVYSEEDSQMTGDTTSPTKKAREEAPAACKKRRKSARGEDAPPAKRGRKPLNRSRHNSDSDDTSEHSMSTSLANAASVAYDRNAKAPRPVKYDFFVEFDPSLNSNQRISILQHKLSEIRKTYAEVKAELATVERRRKKLRRREREALKASKQESASG